MLISSPANLTLVGFKRDITGHNQCHEYWYKTMNIACYCHEYWYNQTMLVILVPGFLTLILQYYFLLHDTIQVQRRWRANILYIGTLRGQIVPLYLLSRFGTIHHIWHNCQAANLYKLTLVHLQWCSQRQKLRRTKMVEG